MRQFLSVGQSIADAGTYQPDLFTARKPFVGAAISSLNGIDAPILPQPGLDEDVLADISTMHMVTAFEIGVDPEDPVLHWFSKGLISKFFPDENTLLDFEHNLLEEIGKSLLLRGALAATKKAARYVGDLSRFEKRDFTALSYSWVRAMQRIDTDDARSLQVLRLERMANKARSSLDLRAELAALREAASIQGLRFQTESNEERELIGALSLPRKRPTLELPQ